MGKKCLECWRIFNKDEIVVLSGDKIFCAPEHSPLEPDSCALNYLGKHLESLEKLKSYFFIKLPDYEDERIS